MLHSSKHEKFPWVVGFACVAAGTVLGYSISIQRRKFLSDRRMEEKASSHLWKIVEYSLSSTIIRVADQLDLFERLHERGSCTSRELAGFLGCSERWLREVLLQLSGSGICSYEPATEKFALKAEYAAFLRGPEKERKSMAGMFQFLSALVSREDAVVEGVQTGIGIDYDFGSDAKDIGAALDRKNSNFFRYSLIDELRKIKMPRNGASLGKKLEEGICVADVGCGFGTSTVCMARQFPNSDFYAFESSIKALQAIKANVKAANVSNVTICAVPERSVADGPDLNNESSTFDFIYTHDVLHDMLNPKELIKDVKKRLSKEGCWLIVDIECCEAVENNLRLPNAAMLYAFSCLLCLSMATSEPRGEGLGTCGFPSKAAERWMRKAGFQYFEKRNIAALPYNACYLVA